MHPVDHGKRLNVISQWEPRWAMQRYRNQKYETAKFEKVTNLFSKFDDFIFVIFTNLESPLSNNYSNILMYHMLQFMCFSQSRKR